MFRAILSIVSRFRAHKSSLHSQRCSRIWTLHSHTGSPCKSRNAFPSRFLPAPRKCLASQRKSLTLYVSLFTPHESRAPHASLLNSSRHPARIIMIVVVSSPASHPGCKSPLALSSVPLLSFLLVDSVAPSSLFDPGPTTPLPSTSQCFRRHGSFFAHLTST